MKVRAFLIIVLICILASLSEPPFPPEAAAHSGVPSGSQTGYSGMAVP